MQNGALDGSFLIEPQATVAASAGYGVRFMNTDDFYPHQQITVLFYSEKFATERADVAARLMRAWLRGARTYNDAIKDGHIAGPGADAVVETMAKSFSMDPELVRRMFATAIDPNGDVNAAGIQNDLDFFQKQGWVSGGPKAADFIDMSFARKAAASLGPYQRP
jgi:NitT/TauT family transport system substrate-binding protein